jgi:DNA repair exonuclease SbcCD ATPase subunit
MIPGNHDANLNNAHRMDALTPIVNALNEPNLLYVKDTGYFKIANRTFVHWSVFDKEDKYVKADKIKGDYKIALFHGPVTGVQIRENAQLLDQNLKISDFEGFDIGLLGDIHTRQFLDGESTIGYPGSLIQQNHGETIGKGIYVWDLENKKAEYVEIENDTAFYTINVDTGVYDPVPSSLPENLYLRVRYKNTTQSVIKDIVSIVKQTRNVVESSIQKVNDFSNSETGEKRLHNIDVRDVTYQNTILTGFLESTFGEDTDSITRVLEINTNLNKLLSKSEVPRNSMWIPKKFEFDNMFSYGKGNVIDFSNMEGTYGIFAPNASGKSTLLDSITYCIFDKCSKTAKAGQVMNNQSTNFNCKLNFELHGKEYTIERKGIKQKQGNVKVNVDFYYTEGEDRISLNGKDRSDTNAKIREVMGNYEDFVLTALSVQNNNTGFIDMSQSDRKDLLSQFLDINVFEELYQLANNEMRDVLVLLREYQKEDHHQLLRKSEFDIETFEIALEEAKEEKSTIENKRSSINSQILDKTAQLIPVDRDIVDINGLEEQKTAVETGIAKVVTFIDANLKALESVDSKITELNAQIIFDKLIKDINLEDYSHKLRSHQLDTDALQQEHLKLSHAKANLKNSQKKMEKLAELKYDPNCKFCMDNVFVKDAIETKNTIASEEQSVSDIEEVIKTLEKRIKHWSSAIEIKEAKDKYDKSLQDLEGQKNRLNAEDNKLNKKLNDAKTLLSTIESKIEAHNQQQQAIETNNALNIEILELNKSLKAVEKELNTKNEEIVEISANKKLEESNKIKYEKAIEKLKDLEVKSKDYQQYLAATHRDGIPHMLIASIIPSVEEEINNILAQIVDFSIVLQAEDKSINAYIAYSEEDFWPLELTSGMEKFIASLAIRTSLINVSSLPKPNFLAIDEGFGALDSSNLNSMVMLFDYLKTQFKFIMIISHIDSMRDIVDSHIEINKTNGKSKIAHP